MKELSIEQKAKRFDEVLAIAKECITYVPDDAVNKYMLNMFPELKESEDEDEKTRKELIELIGCMHDADPRKKGWLAWLEKQGEKEPTDEEMKELLRTEYEKGRADALSEMKSSWSEEDKEMLKGTLALIETVENINNAKDGFLDVKIWLRTLKDRVQPKQGWDEDDIYMLEQAIKCVNNSEKLEVSTEDIEEWLKALGIRMTNKQ